MKCTAAHVLAAGLLLSGASLIQAQSPEPPHLLRILREDVKSGKGAAHEKVEASFVRAFAKGGYPSWIAVEGITDSSQVWYLESYDSYEALEKTFQLTGTEPLKTVLGQWDAQHAELTSSMRQVIATYQKDVSYLPVPSNLVKARFVTINTVRVRPGHVADFAEMRKLVNAAFEKSGSKQRRVVYSVNSGAPAGTYLILSVMDSLKAMDPPPGAMSMADAFGADMARYSKLQSEIVISSENTMFGINPKVSNPPKEFIAADPDFWAPKPKPAAAKPAATPPAGQ